MREATATPALAHAFRAAHGDTPHAAAVTAAARVPAYRPSWPNCPRQLALAVSSTAISRRGGGGGLGVGTRKRRERSRRQAGTRDAPARGGSIIAPPGADDLRRPDAARIASRVSAICQVGVWIVVVAVVSVRVRPPPRAPRRAAARPGRPARPDSGTAARGTSSLPPCLLAGAVRGADDDAGRSVHGTCGDWRAATVIGRRRCSSAPGRSLARCAEPDRSVAG